MIRKIRKISFLIFILAITGCGIENKKTTLKITDNGRHYYPILRGQKLHVIFPIENIGKNPFILSDVFTSCGCMVLSKKSSIKAIPAGRTGNLILEYNSDANTGYVKQYITLYGNFDSAKQMTLTFDVNVVPEPQYTKDYEQRYLEDNGGVKEAVDGSFNQRGYYMDTP